MIMTIVTIQLPEVKREESRPIKCPYCPGKTFQRWMKNQQVFQTFGLDGKRPR
jgi:hypothetical protein